MDTRTAHRVTEWVSAGNKQHQHSPDTQEELYNGSDFRDFEARARGGFRELLFLFLCPRRANINVKLL